MMKTTLVYGLFLLFSLIIFLFYVIGTARYLTDHDENTCDMTYMFEYPQYVRIRLSTKNDDGSEDNLFPRYRLFAYGEGFVTERLRRMHFSGIPVLFVPGNAGSHEQARSLASISLRKSLKSRTPFHFDYFTVSFGKEYSAFYGGVLRDETNFIAKSIQRIISLYQGKVKNIILIGHSMGGLIAKGALLTVPEISTNVTSILITLATPHKPAIYPDYTFLSYYREIMNSSVGLRKNGVTVISISGGSKDILVPPSQSYDEYADLNVVATNIPGVWRSTDHLCILWCKQLILKIVRALFDCVDVTQKPAAIFESHNRRMKAFNWHFVQQYSLAKHLPYRDYAEKVEFSKEKSDWIEDIRRQYIWSSKNYAPNKSKKRATVYLMIRLNAPIDTLSVDTINLKNKDWIFACSASHIQGQSRVCLWGWNLSNRTKTVPGLTKRPWKNSIDIDFKEIENLGATHVVIRIPAQTLNHYDDDDDDDDDGNDEDDDDDNQIIQVDVYSKSDRHKSMNDVQPWYIDHGKIRYYVTLDGINDVVSVNLKSLNCTENKNTQFSMVELVEPWIPNSGQINLFSKNDESEKTMRLQNVQSPLLHSTKLQNAELKISLDPTCSYKIHIQRGSIVERISHMVKDRWTLIYPISVGLLLLCIGQKFDQQTEDKTSFIIIIFITVILCASLNLVIECCVAVIILHILAIGISCSVVFFGSVAHNVAVRFLARAVTFSTTWSDWLLGSLVNKLPIVVTGVLLSMIPATCGALAMLLGIFFHFLKLTRMYEDCLEEILFASMRYFNLLRKKDKKDKKNADSNASTGQDIFNEILLFLFWCFASILAIPSALVWAKNFSFSTRLINEDQVFLYSWTIMVACGTSGLVKVTSLSPASRKTKFLVILLRCLGWTAFAISAMPNAAHYYWYFPPSLAIIVLLITLHSLQS